MSAPARSICGRHATPAARSSTAASAIVCTSRPNIPAKNFWSVVAYDADSRSILRSGQPFPSVSTYTGPVANADGSIDIDFGPEAPTGAGSHARNWIQTTPGKGWFTLFRFYGPLEPFFDQDLEARRHRRGEVAASLFVSQRDHRFDANRAAGRHPAGKRPDD